MLFISRFSRLYERAFTSNPKLTVSVTNALLKCLGDFMAQIVPFANSSAGVASFEWDRSRSLRFLVFGFLYGPIMGTWHMMIEYHLPLVRAPHPRSQPYPLSPSLVEKPTLPASPISKLVKNPSAAHARSASTVSNGHALPVPPATAGGRGTSKTFVVVQLLKRVIADQLFYAPLFVATFLTVMPLLEDKGWAGVQERFSTHYWHIVTMNWRIWPWIQLINYGLLPLHCRVPWQGACGVCWTIWLSLSTHPATPVYSTSTGSALDAGRPAVSAAAAALNAVFTKAVGGEALNLENRLKVGEAGAFEPAGFDGDPMVVEAAEGAV